MTIQHNFMVIEQPEYSEHFVVTESVIVIGSVSGMGQSCVTVDIISLFMLRFNVPVNNFSVMSGQSHGFLGITSTFRE